MPRHHLAVLLLLITALVPGAAAEEPAEPAVVLDPEDPLAAKILELKARFHDDFTVLVLDRRARYLEIGLGSFLTSGSDYACAEASKLFYELCSLPPGDYLLKVSNPWVPSTLNPMDVEWAAHLAGLGGAPEPVVYVDEHRERIAEALRERGLPAAPP